MKNKSSEDPTAKLTLSILYAILSLVGWSSFFTTSWVGALLWGWFLTPLGLPLIGVWHMAGLVMFFWVLRPDISMTLFFAMRAANLPRVDEVASHIAVGVVTIVVTWLLALVGYGVHSMM